MLMAEHKRAALKVAHMRAELLVEHKQAAFAEFQALRVADLVRVVALLFVVLMARLLDLLTEQMHVVTIGELLRVLAFRTLRIDQ